MLNFDVSKTKTMRTFKFQSPEALRFAIEFNSKTIGERFSMFRDYLEDQPGYPYEAIDAAKRLAALDTKSIADIKTEMIFTLGQSNAKKACTQLAIELNKYQKATGIVVKELTEKVEALATSIRNTTVDNTFAGSIE
jgi:hypothetical protein